jgi:hypothetical protein
VLIHGRGEIKIKEKSILRFLINNLPFEFPPG